MTLDISRRGVLGIFAATAVAAAPYSANAFGIRRGAGDVRRIAMYNPRTGESIDTVYWVDGKYIRESLNEINYFMRDWRTGQVRGINPNTIDIAAASHRLLQTNEPYMMLSGYRSAQTNQMLSRNTRGVARNSLHIQGMAADMRLKSRSVNQMFRAAVSCAGGGVGKYSRSNFVHMDCGAVRTWGV
ncbi:MAG: DUF882 domain-containing protein [Paracoccus sp. (in: a-proteobacteria)]|uniref:YcbK family protein n=1 Tax=Paracoccus sp. TaxID=267 RepID=UPI0026DEC3E0|nr:DUF882 domain-containing protein [Paracoccus sp. (in: a-proteobacteria)]MDO5622179.1 DUF882 domain-containing protein [Paracoccus sp. (in: a-proteobacteria)]